MPKTVQLNCAQCGAIFDKEKKEFTRRKKKEASVTCINATLRLAKEYGDNVQLRVTVEVKDDRIGDISHELRTKVKIPKEREYRILADIPSMIDQVEGMFNLTPF